MTRKKYLLIGDHRTCENYGSIATCDQLIELMRPRRLTVIPITRMDQDYDYMPLTFKEFDDFADKVKKGLVLKMENRAIDNSDNIIINCEGSLTHHTNASRCEGKYRARTRYMLFLAYYSAKFCGKEVSIVNHCVDPGNSSAEEMIKNVYPLLKRCWVRDNLSKINLEKLGIKSAEFVPDALYKFKNLNSNSLDRKYICIGDTATLGYAEWDVANFFEDIITRLKKQGQKIIFVDGNMWKTTEIIEKLCDKLKVQWVHVDNTNWRDLAEIFRQSKVFFSGRWHASILATISGAPSILYGTDSHKTKALHNDLGIEGRFYELNELPVYKDEIVQRLTSEKYKDESKLVKYANEQRSLLKKFYLDL
jgi:polysaccharide pyruvyl transferase WcaK-like protein